DEVLIPTPAWVSYPDMVKLAGGVPVPLETREEDGFALRAEALAKAVSKKTRLLILNSPSNPTGCVLPPEEIRAVAEVLEKKRIWCLSDEIYEKFLYGGAAHCSIASVSDYAFRHTITVNGASKVYAMTGWRIGYAAGPAEVLAAMGRIQSQSSSNACAIAQAAVEAALRGPQGCVKEMVGEFAARRDLIVKGLNAIPGVRCVMPQGAFYVLPNIQGLLGRTYGDERVETDIAFCEAAIDKVLIAPVPGEPFGAPGHVRLSYATSRANIEKGLARLRAFAES
ncbi:MAG: pyridoxal phosphate-dependent aminotransferase, partial [Planctomycetota bacterium]